MSEMTLSQALRSVKKLKGKLAEHLARAQAGVSYREDAVPAFQFASSIEQADAARSELILLESRIAVTNARTSIDFDGRRVTLAEAVRTLQELKGQIAWYKALAVRAQPLTREDEWSYDDDGKRTRTSVSWKCDLPDARRAEVVDGLQDRFDRLNDAVEKANHATVLVA